jgi:hypothetical protein
MGSAPIIYTTCYLHLNGEKRGLAPFNLERVMGIEPTSSAWKAEVLPLNYTRRTRISSPCISFAGGEKIYSGHPALQVAAPRAVFKIATGDFVNLHRFSSSPVKHGGKPTFGGGGRI